MFTTYILCRMLAKHFKNTNYPWNGEPRFATVVKFEDNIEQIKEWLEAKGAQIESYDTYENALARYQASIDKGELKNRVSKKEEEGSFYEDSKYWKKWTAEEAAERLGAWEKEDVVWFKILKNRDFVYSLILKNGDYIAMLPGKDERFVNLGKDILLPYCSDWEEIGVDEMLEAISKGERCLALRS